jgi:hypothetical protein
MHHVLRFCLPIPIRAFLSHTYIPDAGGRTVAVLTWTEPDCPLKQVMRSAPRHLGIGFGGADNDICNVLADSICTTP